MTHRASEVRGGLHHTGRERSGNQRVPVAVLSDGSRHWRKTHTGKTQRRCNATLIGQAEPTAATVMRLKAGLDSNGSTPKIRSTTSLNQKGHRLLTLHAQGSRAIPDPSCPARDGRISGGRAATCRICLIAAGRLWRRCRTYFCGQVDHRTAARTG